MDTHDGWSLESRHFTAVTCHYPAT